MLLEIGTEEMPARFVGPASHQLRAAIATLLATEHLPATSLRTWATPRRIAVLGAGIPARQPDAEREIRGPAAKAAYAEDGKPTRAAEGFARSVGVPVEALERRRVEGGEYVFARVHVPGKPAADVLAAHLPVIIAGLSFPKTMRWGNQELHFGRPIRWITALLDDDVVPFEISGVSSGRSTRGHRTLSPGPHTIDRAGSYEETLERNFVVADASSRSERIRKDGQRIAAERGGEAEISQSLLDEVTFLVEFPTAFAGRFDPAHLSLPAEILVTVMQHHQRYFAVRGADGGLLPCFVAVRDGDEVGIDTVREGNEWVLGARLADARFFYNEDRRSNLAAGLEKLTGLMFHRDVGSMREKTQRVMALASWMAERIGLDPERRRHLERAALLCKADLATQVVGEFPELQGTIGGIYARLDGEAEPVARAIAEHYRPRGADDQPPESFLGAALSVADRADTLTGLVGAGFAPTGSSDPHGLRRAAGGLLDILARYRRQIPLDASDLLRRAVGQHKQGDSIAQATARVSEFFSERVRAWLQEHGFAHDVVNAVLDVAHAGPYPDFLGALARAEALTDFRRLPDFGAAYEAFDRAYRIWDKQTTTYVPPLTHPAEEAMEQALDQVDREVSQSTKEGDYLRALRGLSRLRDSVAALFDSVLVNDPDPPTRGRRHALLGRAVNLFMRVANFQYLVVPGAREAPPEEGTP
jgi:glycyl-tRNA synthetase beta chain